MRRWWAMNWREKSGRWESGGNKQRARREPRMAMLSFVCVCVEQRMVWWETSAQHPKGLPEDLQLAHWAHKSTKYTGTPPRTKNGLSQPLATLVAIKSDGVTWLVSYWPHGRRPIRIHKKALRAHPTPSQSVWILSSAVLEKDKSAEGKKCPSRLSCHFFDE